MSSLKQMERFTRASRAIEIRVLRVTRPPPTLGCRSRPPARLTIELVPGTERAKKILSSAAAGQQPANGGDQIRRYDHHRLAIGFVGGFIFRNRFLLGLALVVG